MVHETNLNVLCAHHAKNIETCRWVLEQYEHNHDVNNISVVNWIKACKDYLQENIVV